MTQATQSLRVVPSDATWRSQVTALHVLRPGRRARKFHVTALMLRKEGLVRASTRGRVIVSWPAAPRAGERETCCRVAAAGVH